jgi:hypothetical protein
VSSLYSLGMILKNEAMSRWGTDARLQWRMGSGVARDILDQLNSLSLWRNQEHTGILTVFCGLDVEIVPDFFGIEITVTPQPYVVK